MKKLLFLGIAYWFFIFIGCTTTSGNRDPAAIQLEKQRKEEIYAQERLFEEKIRRGLQEEKEKELLAR